MPDSNAHADHDSNARADYDGYLHARAYDHSARHTHGDSIADAWGR